MMRRVLILLLEARVEKLTRALLRHGERHCVGVEAHCDTWAALSEQFDDACARADEARA